MPRNREESEIKVLVTADEAGRLRERLGKPLRRLRQLSYFFETPQDHLAKAELSLRVREESDVAGGDERVLLTVKGMGLRAGALMVRPEVESSLDPATWADLRGARRHFAEVDLPPVHMLREALGDVSRLDLALMGHIENTREVYESAPQGISLELLLDHTTYPDGSSDFEMESELPRAEAGRGARALRSLFGSLGVEWRPAKVGKYVRFRQKIGRDPDAARR